jgi:hypothetical protein
VAGPHSFFAQLVAAAGIPAVFTTYLCPTSGTLWLGGYDPAFMTAEPQYTPSSGPYSAYYHTANLASITVENTTVPVASQQYAETVLDTGTSAFVLGTAAYTALTAAIEANAQFVQIFGTSFFPAANSNTRPCANAAHSKADLDAALPALTLTFGSDASLEVQAPATESYLFARGAQWCSALIGMDQGATTFPLASIMGSPVLRASVVVFDRANMRIGFAPHVPCP